MPTGAGNARSSRSRGPAESLGHRPRARPGLDPRSPPLAPGTGARRGSEDPGGTGSPSAVALCCDPASGATRGEVFAPPRWGSVRCSVSPSGIRRRLAAGTSGRARANSPRIPTARAGLARRICLARKMAATPSASCASHASRNSRSATSPGLRGRPRKVRRRIAVRGPSKQYVASMTCSSSATGCGCRPAAALRRRVVLSSAGLAPARPREIATFLCGPKTANREEIWTRHAQQCSAIGRLAARAVSGAEPARCPAGTNSYPRGGGSPDRSASQGGGAPAAPEGAMPGAPTPAIAGRAPNRPPTVGRPEHAACGRGGA